MVKNLKLRPYFFVLLFLMGSVVSGQEGEGPQIRLQPGEFAKWSLTIREKTPSRAAAAAARQQAEESEEAINDSSQEDSVRKTDYLLTGLTGRAVTRINGEKKEIYLHRYKRNMLMMKFDEGLGRVRPYLFDAYTPPEMRFGVSYPGVDWVKPKHFQAIVERDGERCFHFRQEPKTDGLVPVDPDDELAYDPRITTVVREAWFNAKTGLPLEFKDGRVEGVFSHSTPDKAPLKLPKEFMEAVLYYYGRGPRPVTPGTEE